jgi:hypothetical protein
MMIPTRKLAWALCLVLLSISSSVSNAQPVTSYTGDLSVYGAGSNSYNTGWQSPSGTNFYPYLSNGNYGAYAPGVAVNGSSELNFGVQYTNVSQTVNIPRALPNVQLTGYEFGFTWKNGNNWDNASTDWLTAYVNIYDKNKRAIVQDNYNLAWNSSGWRWFGVDKTFTAPYETSLLSTAKFGFTGQDYNGNWWGYYGPEVGSISFRLKYSMDECSINPLARSNCSGYLDALKRLSTAPVSTTSAYTAATRYSSVTNVSATQSSNSTQGLDVPSVSATVQQQSATNEVATESMGINLGRVSTQSYQSTQSTQSAGSSTNTYQQTTRVETTQTETAFTGSGLTTQSVVSSAQGAVSLGSLNSQSRVGTLQQYGTQLPGVATFDYSISKADIASQYQAPLISTFETFSNKEQLQSSSLSVASQTSTFSTNQFLPGVNRIVDIAPEQVRQNQVEETKTTSTSTKQPPMYEVTMEDLIEQRNVNVIVESGAKVALYVNRSYIDAPFYKVKSVYENQAVIDNSRGHRLLGLGSERKWTEMVDQQYKGN